MAKRAGTLPALFKEGRSTVDKVYIIDYFKGYDKGYNTGVKDTIREITNIVNDSEYPEDLEMDLYDWLKDKGVII